MAKCKNAFALNCPFVSFGCSNRCKAENSINLITQAFAYTYIKIMKSKAKVFSSFLMEAQHG